MVIRVVNLNVEMLSKLVVLYMNISVVKGLQDVLKMNLGFKGMIKMFVGGFGDIKLIKDGNMLFKEM